MVFPAGAGRWLAGRNSFAERLNMVDCILPTHLMESDAGGNGIHRSRIVRPLRRGARTSDAISTRVAKSYASASSARSSNTSAAHLLIKAVRSLPEQVPISLDIYGKMTEFPDFAAKLQEIAAGDPRISFKGTFPNDQIGDVFNTLDCLVVLSLWVRKHAPGDLLLHGLPAVPWS